MHFIFLQRNNFHLMKFSLNRERQKNLPRLFLMGTVTQGKVVTCNSSRFLPFYPLHLIKPSKSQLLTQCSLHVAECACIFSNFKVFFACGWVYVRYFIYILLLYYLYFYIYFNSYFYFYYFIFNLNKEHKTRISTYSKCGSSK